MQCVQCIKYIQGCPQSQMLVQNPSGSVSPSVLTQSTLLLVSSSRVALTSSASAPVSVIRLYRAPRHTAPDSPGNIIVRTAEVISTYLDNLTHKNCLYLYRPEMTLWSPGSGL